MALGAPRLTSVACAAAVAGGLAYLLLRKRRARASTEWRPPIIGHMLEFMADPKRFVTERFARYGPAFTVNLFLETMTVLVGEEAEKALAKHDGKSLVSSWPWAIQRLLGPDAISTVGIHENARLRKLVMGTMGPKQLAAYTPKLVALAFARCDAWSLRSEPLDFIIEAKRYAMDVATTFLFDRLLPTAKAEWLVDTFEAWLGGFMSLLPIDLPVTTFGKGMGARRALLAFFAECLADIRAADDGGAAAADETGRHRSALARLLAARDEHGAGLSEACLLDTSLTLIFAGHDTSAIAMSSSLHALAGKACGGGEGGEGAPEALGRLRAELDAAWDGELESLTYELLMGGELPYLDAFFKEVLRVMPPVVQVPRHVLQPISINGVALAPGEAVGFSHIGTHHLAAAPGLAQPDAFKPERFLGEGALDRASPHAYVPFGAGPRMCLGYQLAKLEVKAFLAVLVRHYEWEVVGSKFAAFPLYGHHVTISPLRRRARA